MKLGPVTRFDKGNKNPSKKFGDNVMFENYDSLSFSDLWLIWSNQKAGFRTHSV